MNVTRCGVPVLLLLMLTSCRSPKKPAPAPATTASPADAPPDGIQYFVVGSGGQLREGNIDRGSGLTARGFDSDLAFMAAEIADDEMYFNAISRSGQIIDSGVVTRRKTTR